MHLFTRFLLLIEAVLLGVLVAATVFVVSARPSHAQSGRLTPQQGYPVPVSDYGPSNPATMIYWEPSPGDALTISGKVYHSGEMALSIAGASGSAVHAIYAYADGNGATHLGIAGPWQGGAWGINEPDATMALAGVNANAQQITLAGSSGPVTLQAGQATRLGLIFVTNPGQYWFTRYGGPSSFAPILGMCNDYNRVPVNLLEEDLGTGTWNLNGLEVMHGTGQNSIYFLSCSLGQSFHFHIHETASGGVNGPSALTVLGATDKNCGVPGIGGDGYQWLSQLATTSVQQGGSAESDEAEYGFVGFHNYVACEESGGPMVIYGNGFSAITLRATF